MTSTRPLIVGFGNPLRQDDGIGWRAAELLERELSPGEAEVILCHQLTPELAASFECASLVLFLDAACDQPPGHVSSVPVHPETTIVWSHYLTPGQLLGLSEKLGAKAPPAFLIRGGIRSMELAEGLTECGQQTAFRMAGVAHELLQAAFTLVWTP